MYATVKTWEISKCRFTCTSRVHNTALQPATSDTWVKITTKGAPRPAANCCINQNNAIWTGSEMLVWGRDDKGPTEGRYDPSTDSWRLITKKGAPSRRGNRTAVWTGTEMIIWGGLGLFQPF